MPAATSGGEAAPTAASPRDGGDGPAGTTTGAMAGATPTDRVDRWWPQVGQSKQPVHLHVTTDGHDGRSRRRRTKTIIVCIEMDFY